MVDWIFAHIQPLINTVGLVFDILGAILVASEVVNRFKGGIYEMGEQRIIGLMETTNEYKKWEEIKHNHMIVGLVCLIIGFILQIASSWLGCTPHITYVNAEK